MTAEDKQYEEEYHKWREAEPERKIKEERLALGIAWKYHTLMNQITRQTNSGSVFPTK